MIAEIVVAVIGPWILKKVKDRDLREAIAHTADAALVLAIRKSTKFASTGELLRAVVEGILKDPTAPRQLKKDPERAERAAAAAIARNTVGLTGLVSSGD